jgi:hypothetical protein
MSHLSLKFSTHRDARYLARSVALDYPALLMFDKANSLF